MGSAGSVEAIFSLEKEEKPVDASDIANIEDAKSAVIQLRKTLNKYCSALQEFKSRFNESNKCMERALTHPEADDLEHFVQARNEVGLLRKLNHEVSFEVYHSNNNGAL